MLGIEAIKVTPALMNRVCAVDEFKGLWRALETHTTSLQLLSDVAEFGSGFQKILEPLESKPLSTEIICALHGALTKDANAGRFKTGLSSLTISGNFDVAGELETAPPEAAQALLEKLVNWLNQALERGELHPLIVIAVFTAVFLQISPFEKGNMSLCRFLVVLLMLKAGYTYAPYVSLEQVMALRAKIIFDSLKHNQDSLEAGRPDWSTWLDCFMTLMQDQAGVLKKRFEKKEEEVSNLPSLSAKIMALFENHDRLQMKEIIKLTGGRRATIKLRLSELLDQGYLRRHGKARATWYSLV